MDVSVGVPVHPAKEKPPINVVGDVGGRIAIMVVSIPYFMTLLRLNFTSDIVISFGLSNSFNTKDISKYP